MHVAGIPAVSLWMARALANRLLKCISRGLFHAAIGQGVFQGSTFSMTEQEPLLDYVTEHTGCGTALDPVALRVGPWGASVTQASVSSLNSKMKLKAVDGKVIPEHRTEALRNGRFSKVPMMIR